VLHPSATLRALRAPGRIVLVDEAFADAIPGEAESVAGEQGFLVFRSLTKTWSLAGLRAGYALGAPDVLARLAAPRPPWPVSTLALEAVIGCSTPEAVAEADDVARALVARRAEQAAALAAIPGVTVLPGQAPFLLVRLPDGQGERVRGALRDGGIAVRRGDTFPGLGPDHLRVAVRDADAVAQLVDALTAAVTARAAA
ncbi:MAG: histidinol-phosphate aminotransferase, partial [Pseudonocardiales bacterium]|nr:histidinol-phosphate aminotransferase [Pseudonocardiales bacterium]